MNKFKISTIFSVLEHYPFFGYLFKWLLLSLLVGSLVGSASALFLLTLDYVTNLREDNLWVIALLPIGGLIIGLLYHYFGNSVVKGNNQLIEEFHSPKQVIPLKMAPLVFIGTILTHLFGGSAGREGTALQMGGAISDQFTHIFKLSSNDRKLLIIIGISAGFASVFGTPLAGTIFALEVLVIGRMHYHALFPSFITAIIAHYTCLSWDVTHTEYAIPIVPDFTFQTLLWTLICGVLFGITALVFSKTTRFWSDLFTKTIRYAPFRPLIGGIFIASAVYFLGTTKYIGLGVPTIEAAFHIDLNSYDFLLKILFTSFTLGSGFKGGEVTPLFFIGAALGNILIWFVPLPLALLAGMGFVAVFSGATNTPIACTIMGIELFGIESGIYLGIACIVAYFSSGHTGIYSSQKISGPKRVVSRKFSGKKKI